MDIFNEVKEAVLSATPGEDTRNYYRNQGMAIERERIIKLLEAFINDCTQEKPCRNCIGVNWAIAEIKGEK